MYRSQSEPHRSQKQTVPLQNEAYRAKCFQDNLSKARSKIANKSVPYRVLCVQLQFTAFGLMFLINMGGSYR